MRCEVVQLRYQGRPLRRSEWPAPLVGELRTSERAAEISAFKTHTPMLLLYQMGGPTFLGILGTLYFPKLVEIGEFIMLWRGLQLDTSGAVPVEFAQVWLVRPLSRP